jgi:hypothetical protein
MPSTFTTPLGFEKPGLNDYFNAWHTPANRNFDLIAAAIGGTTGLTLTADTTLTDLDGAADQSRAAILNITSSDQHDRVITVPAEGRLYVVRNASAFRVKIKPAAGTSTDIMPGTIADVMVTATHCYRRSVSGWGLHSSVATTSGSSVTADLTGLGQHFTDLMLVLNGVGAGGDLRFLTRNDANTGGAAITAFSGVATLIGAINIPNYRAATGLITSNISADGSTPYQVTATVTNATRRTASGVGSVVISLASGSFNVGAVEVYLR